MTIALKPFPNIYIGRWHATPLEKFRSIEDTLSIHAIQKATVSHDRTDDAHIWRSSGCDEKFLCTSVRTRMALAQYCGVQVGLSRERERERCWCAYWCIVIVGPPPRWNQQRGPIAAIAAKNSCYRPTVSLHAEAPSPPPPSASNTGEISSTGPLLIS